jgi:WD40 repeat protein
VELWDGTTGAELRDIPAHDGDVLSLAFSPDGQQLASGSADTTVKLWQVSNGEEIEDQRTTAQNITVSEGMLVASTAFTDLIKLPGLQNELASSLVCSPGSGVTSMAFTPDRKIMASALWDDTIRLWDVATVTEITTLTGHTDNILFVSFSPDGKQLASAGLDKTVRLWDVASGQEIAVMKGHSGWVNAVTFSPDGKRLASGSDDGTVKLWNIG